MAMRVVDDFETVGINHHARERRTFPYRGLPFHCQTSHGVTAVRQPGQGVRIGKIIKSLVGLSQGQRPFFDAGFQALVQLQQFVIAFRDLMK